jgi:CheY-like chemotaxis protein
MWDDKKAMILSGRNVTKMVQMEKLKSESEYKTMLVNTVSHELRTPANAILTSAKLVQQSGELSKTNADRIDLLISSCSYQLCLINDLLDYAQIVAGSLKISKLPVKIRSFFEECSKFIEVQLSPEVSLHKSLDCIPKVLLLDPNRLKQIILNLLSNARKFTRKGSITFEVTYRAPNLIISCKDTGIGIPQDKLAKLFTQFGKLENGEALNSQGVGLGLVISNMLVQKLGGNGIVVTSVPGKGSCFSFGVQAEEVGLAASGVAEEDSSVFLPGMLTKSLHFRVDVLVVDDVYFNIMAYLQIFKAEGIYCDYALSGEEAIEMIKRKKYALVLMDCEMPGIDGWQTVERLAEMRKKGQVGGLPPIIATTAYNREDVREKCFSVGMHDVVMKPCEKRELMAKVMALI